MSNIQSLQWKSGVRLFCLSTLIKSFFKSHSQFDVTSGRLKSLKKKSNSVFCTLTKLAKKIANKLDFVQNSQNKKNRYNYSISCSITSNMNLANNLSMYEVLFVHLAENFKGSHFEFLSRLLSGETLCKLLQIFPPKVLVYIWTSIPWHLFYYLMAIHLTN